MHASPTQHISANLCLTCYRPSRKGETHVSQLVRILQGPNVDDFLQKCGFPLVLPYFSKILTNFDDLKLTEQCVVKVKQPKSISRRMRPLIKHWNSLIKMAKGVFSSFMCIQVFTTRNLTLFYSHYPAV
jgi:hypothetical protein